MNLENKINEIKSENLPTLSNKNLFLNFLTRIYELFCVKLINIRTVIFIIATCLVVNGNIDQWGWILISLLWLGEKWIKLGGNIITKIKG